jgi:hypothetical protein
MPATAMSALPATTHFAELAWPEDVPPKAQLDRARSAAEQRCSSGTRF